MNILNRARADQHHQATMERIKSVTRSPTTVLLRIIQSYYPISKSSTKRRIRSLIGLLLDNSTHPPHIHKYKYPTRVPEFRTSPPLSMITIYIQQHSTSSSMIRSPSIATGFPPQPPQSLPASMTSHPTGL